MIFVKSTEAILDYTINWNDGYLASGETLSTSIWTIYPTVGGGVVVDSDTNDTTTTTVTISAGRHGKMYRLRNKVTTSGSRTDTRTVYVLVWDNR